MIQMYRPSLTHNSTLILDLSKSNVCKHGFCKHGCQDKKHFTQGAEPTSVKLTVSTT